MAKQWLPPWLCPQNQKSENASKALHHSCELICPFRWCFLYHWYGQMGEKLISERKSIFLIVQGRILIVKRNFSDFQDFPIFFREIISFFLLPPALTNGKEKYFSSRIHFGCSQLRNRSQGVRGKDAGSSQTKKSALPPCWLPQWCFFWLEADLTTLEWLPPFHAYL